MRRSRIVACAALSLLVAACGSTVQASRSVVNGTGGIGTTGGLGGPPAAAASAGPDGSAPGGLARPGDAGSGSSSSLGPAGSAYTSEGSAQAGGSAALVGAGVSPTTINIGLEVTDNSKAAAAALGASGQGVGGGDAEAQFNIIINDINAHGGVLGHRLNPLIYHYDATSTDSLAQQESAACAYWTQDHKVLAVAAGDGTQSNTLLSCLNKAGVIQVHEEFSSSDLSTFGQFPYYFEIGTLDADRMAAAWPAQLKAQGYFGGWDYNTGTPSKVTPVKIGILSFDDASSTRAVTKYLEPALKALGYPFEYERVLYPTGEADNGTSISQTQNVVLKFRSDNVSHVLPVESLGAGIGGFFARGASGQRYYPRFGLTSGNGAQVLVGAGVWPNDELAGAMGYGWVPLADVNYADNPSTGADSNASRRHCVKLMRDHGQTVSDAITERQVVEACDQLYFIADTLRRGGALNRNAFLQAVNGLGGGFVAGDTFSTFFSGNRHDGVAEGRPFAYTPSCTCFRYSGSRFRIP
jgi:hypothetical protein